MEKRPGAEQRQMFRGVKRFLNIVLISLFLAYICACEDKLRSSFYDAETSLYCKEVEFE